MHESQKRQIAYKVYIKDILEGDYIKEEGWQPNYIITKDGREISRINIIGIVISKDTQSAIIDDGSGTITIRSFDENQPINNLKIGDILLIIGRPREFQDQKYIIPEILKHIKNEKWIELRKIELKEKKGEIRNEERKKKGINKKEIIKNPEVTEEKGNHSSKPIEEINEVKGVENIKETNSDKIYKLIKELDKGDGAEFDVIIIKSNIKEAENIIDNLLKEGEIFQNKPGRLKVLE